MLLSLFYSGHEVRCCLVAQSCPTLCNPVDCGPPGSSVDGILLSMEWVAISFSRGSSQTRDWTCVSCIGRWILYHWATGEAPWGPLQETNLSFSTAWTWVERQQVRNSHGRKGSAHRKALTLNRGYPKSARRRVQGEDPSFRVRGPWLIVESGVKIGLWVLRKSPRRRSQYQSKRAMIDCWIGRENWPLGVEEAHTLTHTLGLWQREVRSIWVQFQVFPFTSCMTLDNLTSVSSLENWDKNLH